MRANVKVVGTGKRRKGVSAAGNSYDFTPVSIVFEDGETEGLRAETINIDQNIISEFGIAAGQQCDMVFHFVKGRAYLDAVI